MINHGCIYGWVFKPPNESCYEHLKLHKSKPRINGNFPKLFNDYASVAVINTHTHAQWQLVISHIELKVS